MSAKNYADCPQCKKNFAEEIQEKYAAIKDKYGAIPEEEYLAEVEELKAWRSKERSRCEEVLAEYYEHYFEGGRFKSHYRAVCTVCDFEHAMVLIDEKCELK